MADKIVAQCACGKKYRVPASKAGKRLKCKRCGESFTVSAPEPAAAAPPPLEMSAYAPPPLQIDEDMDVRDPDDLMVAVNRSNMPKTMIIAVCAHLLVIGLTSFSYYADVANFWPLWHPNDIDAEKRKIEKDAKEKKRKEERAKREAERQKEAEAAAAKEAARKKTTAEATEGTTEGGQPERVPEVVKEANEVVKEQPAGTSVSLDDDLNLVE